MKNEMLNCLWDHMGTNDPYFALISLDKDLARRMEDAYAADYEAAPERENQTVDLFAAATDPDYVPSKDELIRAWAVDLKNAVIKAYIAQFSADELEAMRKLLSSGGLDPQIRICQGVTIDWTRLERED